MLSDRQILDFKSKIDVTKDCWNWCGHITKYGYGRTEIGGQREMAHRVAYLIFKGDPGSLCVLHKCDNRRCCKPDHLFLGTRQENNADRDIKGRHVALKGTDVGTSKLTDAEVKKIRFLYALGGYNQTELGAKFNVHHSCISLITTNKHWKHLGVNK